MDDGTEEASLTFREQEDGRKVARLRGGKVVLVDLAHRDRVEDGQRWQVRLQHHENFAVAEPIELLPPATIREKAPSRRRRSAAALREAGPPRVAVFVDGGHLEQACAEAGYTVDWQHALKQLGGGTWPQAFYYLQGPTTGGHLDEAVAAGFVVRHRPQGDGVAAEMVLDLMATCGAYDVAYIACGAGMLDRAVEVLRGRGRRIHLIASAGTLDRTLARLVDKPLMLLEEQRETLGHRDASDDAVLVFDDGPRRAFEEE